MKYLDFPSMDVSINLAMEYFLADSDPFPGEDICWFWNTVPTVVIGNYQVAQAEVNLPYLEENGIALVRRHSGGGTIYSDRNNLMFSFVTRGNEDGLNFRKFTAPLVDFFNQLGLPVTHSGRNDMFLHGRKFSGNAQFHHNGFTIHHGTLLIDTDFNAMSHAIIPPKEKIVAKGVSSVREHVINLKPYLPPHMDAKGLSDALRAFLCDGVVSFSEEQKSQVRALTTRFTGWEVLFGKSPKFSLTRTHRFEGGCLAVDLEVVHGVILSASAHGDFFGDPKPMCCALTNVPYTKTDLQHALQEVPLPHGIDLDELVDLLSDVTGR